MLKTTTVNHKIQKYIIDLLRYTEIARFSELRPPRTDTNLFSYHLNVLIKLAMVVKVEGGYTLGTKGLGYVDRVTTQPKIITMLLIQNGEGDILLQRRTKQPYINTWTLPYGKLHSDDNSLKAAAQREAFEKLGLSDQAMTHAGDCYIRVTSGGDLISTTLAHIFKFNSDDIGTTDDLVWARPHKLSQYRLAPVVEQIMTRGFFNDPFFFEEFESEWV